MKYKHNNSLSMQSLKIVLIYVFFGSVWIAFSDIALETMISNNDNLSRFQTYKGWFFIIMTALLLFQLIKQQLLNDYKVEKKLIKSNRLYETQSQINQAIIRERDQQKLFQEICNIFIEFGKFRLVWIGLIDEENKYIKPSTFSGEGSDYLKRIQISFSDELLSKGPTGRAINERKSIVFNDLQTNPDFAQWRTQAIEKGYHSSAAFPIRLNDNIIGTLNVYSAEPHFFDEKEITLIEAVAMDISFALEKLNEEDKRKQVEDELNLHRNHLEEMVKEGTANLKDKNKELEDKNKELEQYNRLFEDREFRIKELKDKVKVLEAN